MSGTQVSSFYPVNQLLVDNAQQISNQYAPQRNELLIQRSQQEIGGTEIEYAARAAQGLLGLGDEAAMAAAYPGAVANAQQYGFLKNAPSVFPGKARLEQIAAMGTSSEKLGEQRGVASDYQTWLRSRGGGGTQGTVTPGAVPAVAPGGGFTGDREKDRAIIVKQESGGDPTVLNYVARQDPTAYARGATASGKYQFVNSTWREGLQLAGLDPAQYPEARQAPEAVQDKVFDAVYGKYGTKPWEKGAKDWVRDEHGNYQVATVRPPAGSPGGAPAVPGTPPPYQLAGQPVGPPGTPPAAGMPVPGGQGLVTRPDGTVGTPNAGGLGTGAPPAAVAAPAQPPPAATPAAPVANIPPPAPRMANGLDAEQNRTIQQLEAIRPRNRAEFDQQQKLIATTEQTYRQHNETVDRQYRTDVQQAQQHAQTQANTEASAAALAEQRRIENARAGVPTGHQRNSETGVIEPIPGYKGATEGERLEYDLRHADPGSQEYAEAWKAKKWQIAPNGNVIEQDMSGYTPPTRSIQRPTFIPQPTGTALDEVRKADTDARVIVPAIDRYVDLHKGIAGSSWGAFFDNPRDPKAQQLIGAFNAMKTVLRSPTYANTGVLQPAEMEMLKQELVSPQTIRGLYATPQALEARLHEIKFAILSRQDAELRSVGRDGVIVRDKSDLAKIPEGGKFYDEDGNLRIKPRAE